MKAYICACVLLCCQIAAADDWVASPAISKIFADAGIDGTFVVYDIYQHQLIGHNEIRADQRYVPASTFKIPHTLIGLSTGAVANLDEVLPYGGQEQVFDSWEADMSLRQAMALSNPAIYQTLAQRIGPIQMRQHMAALIYGNREFASTMRPFWLDGSLEISAVEQVRFLSMLTQDALPYPRELLETVRELIYIESGTASGETWALYGKTGWENAPGPGIGWWVGWIEKGDKVYPFAMNMNIRKEDDARWREVLGRASLAVIGLL